MRRVETRTCNYLHAGKAHSHDINWHQLYAFWVGFGVLLANGYRLSGSDSDDRELEYALPANLRNMSARIELRAREQQNEGPVAQSE
jgi:hypothetical protein